MTIQIDNLILFALAIIGTWRVVLVWIPELIRILIEAFNETYDEVYRGKQKKS